MNPPTFSQLSKIKWGKSYLWYVRLLEKIDTPVTFIESSSFKNFKGWIPAESISEQVWNIASTQVNLPVFPFEIPKGRASSMKLSLTVYDDENLSIAVFMTKWVDSILGITQKGDGIGTVNTGMKTLRDMTKWIEVVKLGEKRQPLHRNLYEVIPMGEFKLSHNSNSEVIRHNLNFNIITSILNAKM